MPIREKRDNALSQLETLRASVPEIPTLSAEIPRDFVRRIGLLITKIEKDTRMTTSLLNSASSASRHLVSKEDALHIEMAYDTVSTQCRLLSGALTTFYGSVNETPNNDLWQKLISPALARLEENVDSALTPKAAPAARSSGDTPIPISNALLLIHFLSFKVIENQSHFNKDAEGTLRKSGRQNNVEQAFENLRIASRPSTNSYTLRHQAPTPRLLDQKLLETALNVASGHDYTSMIKKIMMDPTVIGLEQHSLEHATKITILAKAQHIEGVYTQTCAFFTKENESNPHKKEQEEINQIALETMLDSSCVQDEPQKALEIVLAALPAYYIEILHSIFNVLHAVSDKDLNNKMNAYNVGLAVSGIFDLIGLCDKLPVNGEKEMLNEHGANKKSLALLTSCWVQEYEKTKETLSKALHEKMSDNIFDGTSISTRDRSTSGPKA